MSDSRAVKLSEIILPPYQSLLGGERIKFDGITIFTGPNSAGKSAVLDFIEELGTVGMAADYWTQGATEFCLSFSNSHWNLSTIKQNYGGEFLKAGWRLDYGDDLEDPEYSLDLESFFSAVAGKTLRVRFYHGAIQSIHLDNDLVFEVDWEDHEDNGRISANGFDAKLYDACEQMTSPRNDLSHDSYPCWLTIDPSLCEKLGLIFSSPLIKFENGSSKDPKSFKSSKLLESFILETGRVQHFYGVTHNHAWGDPYLLSFGSPENAFNVEGNLLGDLLEGSFGETEPRAWGIEESDTWSKSYIAYLKRELFKPHKRKKDDLQLYAQSLMRFGEGIAALSRAVNVLLKSACTDQFNAISGNRQIIDSDIPAAILQNRYEQDSFLFKLGVENKLLGDNLQNLALQLELSKNPKIFDSFSIEEFPYLRRTNKNFVESSGRFLASISDYFKNLSGFELVSTTKVVAEAKQHKKNLGIDSPSVLLIFLRIKNQQKIELNLKDVGSGVSFVLPIISGMYPNQLTFIEEPELHLHPSAQCDLSDIFISGINNIANLSLVLETHSEHLILRLLRRIRETSNNPQNLPEDLRLNPSDINIYYFQPNKHGKTNIKEIRVDKNGEFLNKWPDGFFGEREQELFS